MKWLVLTWALTTGIVPQQNEVIALGMSAYSFELSEVAFSLDFTLKAEAFDFIRLSGSINNFAYQGEGLGFAPYRTDYKISAAFFYGPLEFGVRHECDHPVIFKPAQFPQYVSDETVIYLTVQGKATF